MGGGSGKGSEIGFISGSEIILKQPVFQTLLKTQHADLNLNGSDFRA